ncbi:MAG: hypothetical protein GX352_09650 [Clostridiales bacterium]|nr:hypothetical protein [Clostridiales bacterium]
MLKTYSNKMRTFSYYMGNAKGSLSIFGMILDHMFLLAIIFAFLYIWLVFRTRVPLLSLAISLIVTSLLGFALYLKKKETYKKRRNHVRKNIAREYMASRLSILSKQEFEWQLVRALSTQKELTDIEHRGGYLKAKLSGMPVAIGYYHAPPKGYETYERVWNFYNSLRSKGYTSLFYISSGYFEDACENISGESSKIPITLLDIENLLDLMEKANMGPGEDQLDALIKERIKDDKKQHIQKMRASSAPSKLKRYLASSLLFLGAAFLFRQYFLFYIVLSILFFVLGLISKLLSWQVKKYSSKITQ